MERRTFFVTLGAISACRRTSPSKPQTAESFADFRVIIYDFDHALGPLMCAVLVPLADRPNPILVALHGRGETRSPEAGAYGWLRSYRLDRAIDGLTHPPLTVDHFRGLVDQDHLADVNASLQKQPYEGMIVVCPSMPADLDDDDLPAYSDWLDRQVLPRVRNDASVQKGPQFTAIHGVSMGGAMALELAMQRPDLFGVVGALQPAIREASEFETRLQEGLHGRPLQLVTSDHDYFRQQVEQLHTALIRRQIAHDFVLTKGPHDYIWNQGPGGIEMLLWCDRAFGAQK
jgi:predicted esterase